MKRFVFCSMVLSFTALAHAATAQKPVYLKCSEHRSADDETGRPSQATEFEIRQTGPNGSYAVVFRGYRDDKLIAEHQLFNSGETECFSAKSDRRVVYCKNGPSVLETEMSTWRGEQEDIGVRLSGIGVDVFMQKANWSELSLIEALHLIPVSETALRSWGRFSHCTTKRL